MGKTGRPEADLDDYLDWRERLENYKASDLSVEDYCDDEGVSRSSFYRWKERLRNGIPETIAAEAARPDESNSSEAEFLPVSLKSPPVEIELPNGGVVRLPLGVGKAVLLEVIGFVGALRS